MGWVWLGLGTSAPPQYLQSPKSKRPAILRHNLMASYTNIKAYPVVIAIPKKDITKQTNCQISSSFTLSRIQQKESPSPEQSRAGQGEGGTPQLHYRIPKRNVNNSNPIRIRLGNILCQRIPPTQKPAAISTPFSIYSHF